MRENGDILHRDATEHIRKLPFIRDVTMSTERVPNARATLTLATPGGEFTLPVETVSSHLSRMAVNALIGRWSDAAGRPLRRRPLLLARYLARPTAQRLIDAGICFADRAGNLHLALGDHYHAIVLGKPDRSRDVPASIATGARFTELLFALLMRPELLELPLRSIAQATGIGKSVVDEGIRRLLRDGVLVRQPGHRTRSRHRVAHKEKLASLAMRNYEAVLRPRLELGRYRRPEMDREHFLLDMNRHLRVAKEDSWGFTGSAAAWALQKYYPGDSVTAFIREVTPDMQRALRLIPDPGGPITFLQMRAPVITIDESRATGLPTAHPWLVYAELLHEGTPRAIESAELIRQEFLA